VKVSMGFNVVYGPRICSRKYPLDAVLCLMEACFSLKIDGSSRSVNPHYFVVILFLNFLGD
jgi:hypothetical protein